MSISPTLRAELAELTDAQIFDLLGEILEPSVNSPFDGQSEDLSEALEPITAAYCDAFKAVQAHLYLERNSYHWLAEDRDEGERKYAECVA
jgi:hypothetical protein